MSSFPPLDWDGYCWTGSLVLPSWKGFQARLGAYGGESSTAVSDGSALLNIVTLDDQEILPTPPQVAAYNYLIAHQQTIRDVVVGAIFDVYPQWQEQFGYSDEEKKELMPDLERPNQLSSLVGLSTVRIFATSRSDIAYIGFEFGCTWDDEHGLGAMTHTNRVVEIGGADTAILEWIADNDAV